MESGRNINTEYGDRTMSVSQCRLWFLKFRAGDYNREYAPCPERSVDLYDDALHTLVEQNPLVNIEEQAEKLGLGHSTIHRHLRVIGKVNKVVNPRRE